MPLLNRREFLVGSSATVGAVAVAGCVPPPREMEGESRVLLAEDVLSAYDNWYATTCRGCDAGCGAIVRVVDGRARKVEGNPEHPLNRGKLCARGQAVVQEQYHPDRIQSPLKRDAAQRSGGAFEPAGWQAGLDSLAVRLQQLRQSGRADDVTLVTPPLAGHQALLVERFASAYGLKWYAFEPIADAPLREAVRRVFGYDQLPWFDVAGARTVLSIGADFLGSWLSPVRFGLEYGVFRQGSYDVRQFQPHLNNQGRGRLIHVESRFSATAASADEWVWVRPGQEGVLALGLAQALGASGLDAYAAEQTAQTTGVDPARVRRIAAELRDGQPSLVIGGGSAGAYTNGTDALAAILSLNLLLDNVGKPGGIVPPPAPLLPDAPHRARTRPLSDWQDLVSRLNDGREQLVMVLGGADPTYGLPDALGFKDALLRAPTIVSFNSFLDATTQLADLVLPSSLGLESWGDALPRADVLSVQQPVVSAIFDTRSVWDVLLAMAATLDDAVRNAAPWPTFKDLLQAQLDVLRPTGTLQAQFWSALLQHGGQWPQASTPGSAGAPSAATSLGQAQFGGSPDQFPLFLVPFVHNTLGAGEAAHLPWLQSAPDPVTTVTWQTWIELNPQVAAALGVAEGDIVVVESPRARAEVPVYVSPAAPPEVVAIPLGQGHTGFGRWATGRGINPLKLLEPLADAATGALAYGSTRVKLSKAGRSVALAKLEGIAPPRQLTGQEVIKVDHL